MQFQGRHVVALGGHLEDQVVFISLFSVANAAGRLVFGFLSETYMHRYGTHRTVFLSAVSMAACAFSLSMCFARLDDLYAMALMGGLSFGGLWAIIPSLISDVFGLVHFASTYSYSQFSPAFGGLLLGSVLIGVMYDKAHTRHGDGGNYCIGRDCYGTAWAVLTGFNVVAFIGSRVLGRICAETYDAMWVGAPGR
ncbi:hypothetical protein FOA52_007508 [Chlamydomonas sp. UWO 241]|nr:hypothetical protein FOA52_007508 [Chlamydomonas sp. UWO 241]